ncbi:HEAT repeat domain-containing protein [Halorubrum pallidum]
MPCPICRDGPMRPRGEFPVRVCEECDQRAVNEDGDKPWTGFPPDAQPEEDLSAIVDPPSDGENPVFIDGHKCWRRYRMIGWKTYLDYYDCDTLREFYIRHGLMEPHESRPQITPDDQSLDPKQGEGSSQSPTEDRRNNGEDDASNDVVDLDYSDKDRGELRDIIIQGAEISSKSRTTNDEIQQIAGLVGGSQWSSLAVRYLVMVANDEPENALEALPTVASSYGTADAETRQWIMHYFARLSKTHPDALLPVLDTLIDGISEDEINIQSNALATLGRIVATYPNVGSGLVDDIAELLVHVDSKVRKNAVGLLGDIAQEYQRHVAVHAATIAMCLRDDEGLVRRNASIALVRCGEADPETIRQQSDLLEQALTDDQPEVRRNACALIGNAKPSVSTERLERLAEDDPNPKVKEMAQWALSQITD